jgi:hypothetical protein
MKERKRKKKENQRNPQGEVVDKQTHKKKFSRFILVVLVLLFQHLVLVLVFKQLGVLPVFFPVFQW